MDPEELVSPPSTSRASPLRSRSASHTNSLSRLDPLPATHPLSQRIRSVLDASTAAASSRDSASSLQALQDLEERYAASHSKRREKARGLANGHKGRRRGHHDRPARILIDTDKARQNVEDDAQDAHVEATSQFLQVLGQLDDAVQDVGSILRDLRTSCDGIEESMQSASLSTQYLSQQARGIQQQRLMTMQNAAAVDLFLKQFTLSLHEHDLITSRTYSVDTDLFAVIDKLKAIRKDSQILLVGQDEGVQGGMRAGIDVIEEATTLIDAAQQKIAKWLQGEMRAFSRDSGEASDRLRDAVARLDNREDLLRPVLATLAMSRANVLSSSFHRALTVGGPAPSYLPRPIEMHAHDPMRYVGDMLAWIHQTVASERDFIAAIFSKMDEEGDHVLEGKRRPGQRRKGLNGSVDWTSRDIGELSHAEQWIRGVLDKVIEGCASTLKTRVGQTVRSQEGCITAFRLTSLLQFYRVTMERTLGRKASICLVLKDLSITAHRCFVATLDGMTAGLSRFSSMPEDDLGAPPPVVGTSTTLKELLTVHQMSLAEAELFGDALPLEDLESNEARDFSILIQRLIQPILDLCRRMGDAHVDRRPKGKSEGEAIWERNIFAANCLACVRDVTEPFSFTSKANAQLDAAIGEHLDALVVSHVSLRQKKHHCLDWWVKSDTLAPFAQHERLLDESGLGSLILDPSSVDAKSSAAAFASFEGFLASPTLLSSPHLGLLASPAMRAEVHARALELIAQDYETALNAAAQIAIGIDVSKEPLLPRRDVREVQLLLGISRKMSEPSQDASSLHLPDGHDAI